MSLSDRLAQVKQPTVANRGCRTCKWLNGLSEKDRHAIDEWIQAGHSLQHLYRLCSSDPENPVTISLAAFRNHFRDCKGK